MKVQKKDWQTYEELAARIYRKLAPDSVVTHNDSIYGYDSESNRQIDVSIRSTAAGRHILAIVQARDRIKAPDVNSVGEFASVIHDVRADSGVMVCRKPPGKNAATLAKHYKIDMCSAFDVNDHKWSNDVSVPVVVALATGELLPSYTFSSPPKTQITLPPRPAPGFVSIDGGKTRTTLLDYMTRIVAAKGITASGTDEIVIRDDNLHILLNDTDWVPLPYLFVKIAATVRKLFRHCQAHEYLALKNYSTGELTVAEMKLELPPFHNTKEWRIATCIEPYDQVVENVPVVDLQLSAMAQSGTYGLRCLPESEKANW